MLLPKGQQRPAYLLELTYYVAVPQFWKCSLFYESSDLMETLTSFILRCLLLSLLLRFPVAIVSKYYTVNYSFSLYHYYMYYYIIN